MSSFGVIQLLWPLAGNAGGENGRCRRDTRGVVTHEYHKFPVYHSVSRRRERHEGAEQTTVRTLKVMIAHCGVL